MKKLTILLLALAFAAFAAPAMAGDIAVTGTYQFDAESWSGQGDTQRAWYDDELKVKTKITQGAVTVGVDLEVSDDSQFEGAGKERSTGGATPQDLIDNYYVAWATPVEGLSVKFGEYALDFGRKVVIYQDPEAKEIGILFNKLPVVDLGLFVGKMVEAYDDDDNDTDTLALLANFKNLGDIVKKLDFLFVDGDNQAADLGFGYLGLDSAFVVGPVDLAFEYGSISNDAAADEPSFMYLEVGFDRLAGFDINLEYFDSAEDGNLESPFGAGFFFPYQLYGFDSGVNGALNAVTLIGVSGSYKLNDKMTVAGKVLAQGTQKVVDESVGTEIDARFMYKFADNASVQLTYATWTPGDGSIPDGDTETAMRARFDYAF